jgi:uncharacterized membrane protein
MSAAILPRHSALPLLLNAPRSFATLYRIPLVVLVLGAIADLFTTLWNLRLYGPMVETHLVQRWVSELFGVEAGVPLAKAMQLAFVLFVAAWWQPWCRKEKGSSCAGKAGEVQ